MIGGANTSRLENMPALRAAPELVRSKPSKESTNDRSRNCTCDTRHRSTDDADLATEPATGACTGGGRRSASNEAFCVVATEDVLAFGTLNSSHAYSSDSASII